MRNKKWQWSEDDGADYMGNRTKASGATDFEKLDIDGQGSYMRFRIENKHTERKSFSVKKEYFREIERKAMVLHGKDALLRIDFDGDLKLIVMNERIFRMYFDGE